MELKSHEKFTEILTCGFRYDMKDLLNFPPTTQKPESVTSMGYFYPMYMKFELKEKRKNRGIISHVTE